MQSVAYSTDVLLHVFSEEGTGRCHLLANMTDNLAVHRCNGPLPRGIYVPVSASCPHPGVVWRRRRCEGIDDVTFVRRRDWSLPSAMSSAEVDNLCRRHYVNVCGRYTAYKVPVSQPDPCARLSST